MEFVRELSRADFEEMCEPLWERCLTPLREIMQHEDAQEVTKVVLIGGSSRIPKIQEIVANEVPNATVHCDLDMDEAVAIGASYIAGTMMGCKEASDSDEDLPLEKDPSQEEHPVPYVAPPQVDPIPDNQNDA